MQLAMDALKSKRPCSGVYRKVEQCVTQLEIPLFIGHMDLEQ